MKFCLKPTGYIEVTGIKKVVEDQKFVWLKKDVLVKSGTIKTTKWFKYSLSKKGVVGKDVLLVHSLIEMHTKIEQACFRKRSKAWISGDVINITNKVG